MMMAVLAVVAAGLWGEWFMDRAAEQWQLASHWTEWFDEDLVWGSSSLTMVSMLEYVILAPLFEELVFRGLLFAILRRKFRFLPAAASPELQSAKSAALCSSPRFTCPTLPLKMSSSSAPAVRV